MAESATTASDLESPARWPSYLGAIGGTIAATCYFLPWGQFSFLLLCRSASGYTVGGRAWVIFVLAAIVILAGVCLARRRRALLARWVLLVAALLGLICFVAEAVELTRGVWTPFGRVRPQNLGVRPGPGALGTMVGFLLATAGALLAPGPAWWPTGPARRMRVSSPVAPPGGAGTGEPN